MTSRERSRYWKVGYVVGIIVLAYLLHEIGTPATVGSKEGAGSHGGKLARLRAEQGLSEANLGAINAAGETVKLATLGLRGVAVNLLWEKANDCKMKKDWTGLSAVLEQIAKLQPRFISVWQHQAWNVSYNCSAEFDDYRDRYRWVIKGIEYLREGIGYNQYEPRLMWDQGWFTSHKIGRADEKVQFRRLFRKDDDFHDSLPLELRDPTRDNWLCGKQCFLAAERLDAEGHKMKGMSPLIFHSDAPMCQFNYAEALGDDGVFGDVAERAWIAASAEWRAYGQMDILTTFHDPRTGEPLSIHLNDREAYQDEARKNVEALESLSPGLRQKIEKEKRDALPAKEREALDTAPGLRTARQNELAMAAEKKVEVSHEEVAQRVEGAQRPKALKHAREARLAEQMANYIDRYRQIVNFEYWRLRAKVERTKTALEARKHVYDADQVAEIDLPAARENYDRGLAKWRELLDQFPELLEDRTTGEELVEVIDRYKALLGRMDDRLPPDFVLQKVLDRYGKKQ